MVTRCRAFDDAMRGVEINDGLVMPSWRGCPARYEVFPHPYP